MHSRTDARDVGSQDLTPSWRYGRSAARAFGYAPRLSGVLTLYPVDVGVYEWAIEAGLFSPKKPHEEEPPFIGGFTTASQPHHHYEDGRPA